MIIIISFLIWKRLTTDWLELSSSERKSIQEYKKEVGVDYIYCMRVKASKESYEAIIESRKLTNKAGAGKHFSIKCKDAKWWDVSDYTQPEFANEATKDSLELITRIDGVIYFTSEVW